MTALPPLGLRAISFSVESPTKHLTRFINHLPRVSAMNRCFPQAREAAIGVTGRTRQRLVRCWNGKSFGLRRTRKERCGRDRRLTPAFSR